MGRYDFPSAKPKADVLNNRHRFRPGTCHATVNHSAKEYSRLYDHSNTAENFFSIFKRGVIGTYHHLSQAHLHRYNAEFDFRYSTREMTDGERAAAALTGIEGKRLTYRRTAASWA